MSKIVSNILVMTLLALAGIFMGSCDDGADLVDDITVPIPFTVPVSLETDLALTTVSTDEFVSYPEIPVNVDIEAKIKEKYPELSISNLKSGQLDSFSIEYISSAGGTQLNAIKDAELYIKTPVLPALLVAKSLGNINPTAISFVPEPEVELLEYLKSKENSYVLRIRGSVVASDSIKIKVNSAFQTVVGL
ncbi:hypothetical protein [Chryseobacterium sp. SC28]|uniref:hypothetical protein n=1 Tax=Chryseobacterium sp. SC28 TaxID=2268028 RepID=UPI000F654CDC|nr:hypothetical protein [Chryseobacterium sp. SC28]